MGVRLVVMGPQYSHSGKAKDSSAYEKVTEILSYKGASPRYCKNLLLFLAPDKTKLDGLVQSVCQFLAWDSIIDDKDALNLDVSQSNQATQKQKDTDKTVDFLLQETYQWLLVPTQPDPQNPIIWEEIRLQGQDSLILRASRKLIHEEHLIANYSASRLRLEVLDLYIWRNANHIDSKALWKYLTNYPYLPRLKNEQVLIDAIQEGVAALLRTENFAYATGYDEAKQRYLGLKACEHITATLSSQSWLVKPDVADRQLIADAEEQELRRQQEQIARGESAINDNSAVIANNTETSSGNSTTTPQKQLRRFYGSIDLDPLRVTRDAGLVANEVLQHLASLVGADVQVTLEVQVQLPDGVPDHVIRTVSENCRTLKFKTHSFEEE